MRTSKLNRYLTLIKHPISLLNKINYKIKRYYSPPPLPRIEKGEIYLHLGCGYIIHHKFINIDLLFAPHIHYRRSINDLSIYKDNSVDLIYASHCLEHFPTAEVPNVLAEWFRVLKKGAICRISIPNFDSLLIIYRKTGNNINRIQSTLMGGQNHKYDFHFTLFNKSMLENLFLNIGFSVIQEWQPGSCDLTTFNDWSDYKIFHEGKYYPISLNIEAIK